MPFTVGLTGGIGAGKSTVARILSECGAEIVEGDRLGKLALDTQPDLQNAIRERFGEQVFHGNALNRRLLGELVFTDKAHVDWLTAQTFPFIHAAWNRAVTACEKNIIVFDAALIFEWGIPMEFDRIAVVTSQPGLIFQRAQSGRFDADTVARRLKYQIPIEQKLAQADDVIDNSGTIEDLYQRVRLLYESWTASFKQN